MSKPIKTRAGGQWTEAKFFAFIRSGFRSLSMKWPPRHRALDRVKRPYVGPVPRKRFEYQCEACQRWGFRESVEADHIEECGSLKNFDDLGGFARRLLCEVDGFKVLCKECHKGKKHEATSEKPLSEPCRKASPKKKKSAGNLVG